MVRRPVNSLRQFVDQGGEPGEQSFDNQGVWKRTQSDFVLGAGQPFFDQEDEASRRRFRLEPRVRPVVEPAVADPHPDVEQRLHLRRGPPP